MAYSSAVFKYMFLSKQGNKSITSPQSSLKVHYNIKASHQSPIIKLSFPYRICLFI